MFTKPKEQIGHFFEDLAVDFLKIEGFEILCTRFRCKSGEIDIIARKNDILSFIEVKSRKSGSLIEPVDTIDHRKITRIKKTSQYFLKKNPNLNSFQIRFDLFIFVFNENDMRIKKKEYLTDFFR